jgi:ParB family chromosome partitioning protein
MEELVSSIKAEGVLEPIVVTPNPDPETREALPYRILFGERRFRAALAAGLETLPAVLDERELSGLDRQAVQLAENDERDGLTLLERAEALKHRIETSPAKMTSRELARRLRLSPSYVSHLLALLDYEGPARTALEEGRLVRAETARQFKALPLSTQTNLLAAARARADQITPQVIAAARDRFERRAGKAQAVPAAETVETPEVTEVDSAASASSSAASAEAGAPPRLSLVPREALPRLEIHRFALHLDLPELHYLLTLAGLPLDPTLEGAAGALLNHLRQQVSFPTESRS